jgi:hypothetical protein
VAAVDTALWVAALAAAALAVGLALVAAATLAAADVALAGAAVVVPVVAVAAPPQAASSPTELETTRDSNVRRDNRTACMKHSFAMQRLALLTRYSFGSVPDRVD